MLQIIFWTSKCMAYSGDKVHLYSSKVSANITDLCKKIKKDFDLFINSMAQNQIKLVLVKNEIMFILVIC